jgi:hypothetical protein
MALLVAKVGSTIPVVKVRMSCGVVLKILIELNGSGDK